MVILAALVVMAMIVFGVLAAAVGFVLRLVLSVVLLPFKLLFIALPMALAGIGLAVVFGALFLAGGGVLIALMAVAATAAVPALLVAGAIYLFIRLMRRPALA